jgi:hypothetical protein
MNIFSHICLISYCIYGSFKTDWTGLKEEVKSYYALGIKPWQNIKHMKPEDLSFIQNNSDMQKAYIKLLELYEKDNSKWFESPLIMRLGAVTFGLLYALQYILPFMVKQARRNWITLVISIALTVSFIAYPDSWKDCVNIYLKPGYEFILQAGIQVIEYISQSGYLFSLFN